MTEPERGRLDGIELLRSLSETELRALEQRCRWRHFRAGEGILDRAGTSRDVLFITSGKVRVVNYAPSGREVAFAEFGAGGHVGELSAIDGETRSASVVAMTDCVVASLAADAFDALLRRHAEIAVDLLRHLARIIRISDERIAELSTIGAVQRVSRELLRLATPDPAQPDTWLVAPLPTQQDMASQVGATRETVARALGQLISAGVIRRRGRKLSILDRATLERFGLTDEAMSMADAAPRKG